MFTNEIAEGEDYKKIADVAPYFSFIDPIVKRLLKHNIKDRENDINSVIFDLGEKEMQYEIEENFLTNIYQIPKNNTQEIMNLFALCNYALNERFNWDNVNINYLCDYHFKVTNELKEYIFIFVLNKKIRDKFNYEGQTYNNNSIPYESLNIEQKEDKKLYDRLIENINAYGTSYKNSKEANIMKKLFLSLSDYHAIEVLNSIKQIRDDIDYYCSDSPLLSIAYYLHRNLSDSDFTNFRIENNVTLIKYEESDVTDKYNLYVISEDNYNKLIDILRKTIPSLTSNVMNNELRLFFETVDDEYVFEGILNEKAELYGEEDVRYDDVLDVIKNAKKVELKKVYYLDNAQASAIINAPSDH